MELIKQWYKRRMCAWETRLALRSTNRVVRPFEWGLDWTANWPAAARVPRNGHDPEAYLNALNQAILDNSSEFFDYRTPADFELEGNTLRFTSAVESRSPENNTVHARYFPSKSGRAGKRAVVVLPHWNATAEQHAALCRGIAKLGVSAVRISLPYHDRRMPPELERADYAVSSNIARTIDATRQAVIDVRSCFDWLEQCGYDRLGLVGTSLGSCYAFLASAHDPRIRVNVFNHCSTFFSDVVWTGLSTRHIREGIENRIDLERLRAVWRAISPVYHMDRFAAQDKRSLFIYTTYDSTFLPELSREAVENIRRRDAHHKVVVLPCGHYTLGEAPFKFLDGYHICSFLLRNL